MKHGILGTRHFSQRAGHMSGYVQEADHVGKTLVDSNLSFLLGVLGSLQHHTWIQYVENGGVSRFADRRARGTGSRAQNDAVRVQLLLLTWCGRKCLQVQEAVFAVPYLFDDIGGGQAVGSGGRE